MLGGGVNTFNSYDCQMSLVEVFIIENKTGFGPPFRELIF